MTTTSCLSITILLSIFILTTLSQDPNNIGRRTKRPTPTPKPSKANTTTTTLTPITTTLPPAPTREPTEQKFPCSGDPNVNISDCGMCVKNNSCTWCTYDRTCHETSRYNTSQCINTITGEQQQTISGSDEIYECCATSTTCEECTQLYYVECDWCITSQKCFNSTMNRIFDECDDGKDDNGKEIIYKDGICRTDKKKTFWDKIRDYYLQIPLVFRCILITLSSLCFILLSICLCLCTKNKLNKRKLKKKYEKLKDEKNINKPADYLAYSEPK